MQKVLVVAYFFPPCNLPASNRAFSWAEELHHFGYYPIVVTRRWDHPLKTFREAAIPTSLTPASEQNERFEVHYLPYNANIRDKLFAKYGNAKFRRLRQSLTAIELVGQQFHRRFIPFRNFFAKCDELIAQHSDLKQVVVSGNPFIQFRLGHHLARRYNIKWIADYRDAWTTSEITGNGHSVFHKPIHWLERRSEKKWVGSASLVTASSKPIADSITNLTRTRSVPLYNGFITHDFAELNSLPPFEAFTVTYVGTLYDGQQIELFCNAFKQFIHKRRPRARLCFPGIALVPKQRTRVERAMAGYEEYLECTERMPREVILRREVRSHVLLHVAWKGFQGVIASKIYEYMASGTPVIVVPGDGGAIDEIVRRSGCGVCLNTQDEVVEYLESAYQAFVNGEPTKRDPDSSQLDQFSRFNQTRFLAQLLDGLSTSSDSDDVYEDVS